MGSTDVRPAKSSDRVRRGIAIAGGGAKGAYSFGCLKALAEAGFVFEAVAATSAGALNGAILATGALEAGESLWCKMSPENTYEFHGLLKRLPIFLSRGSLIFLVFIKLLVGRFSYGITIPAFDRLAGLIVGITASAIAGWIIIYHLDYSTDSRMVIGLTAGMVILMLSAGLSTHNTSMTVLACIGISIGFSLLLMDKVYSPFFVMIIHHIEILESSIVRSVLRTICTIIFALSMLITPIAFPMFCFVILYRINNLFDKVVAFSSAPLRATIGEFIDGRDIGIPLFATVAKSKYLIDPDHFRWTNTSPNPSPDSEEYGTWTPNPVAHWVPTYIRVDSLAPERRLDVLTATAALPFGIVPSVQIDSEVYVDGGLADNDPIAPLLAMGLDEIWLLTLDHNSVSPEEHFARAASLLRLLKIQDYQGPAEVIGKAPPPTHNDPPLVVPLMSMTNLPRLVVLKPSRSLGSLFDGTLNFTPAYAEGLIEEGYLKAKELLQNEFLEV